MSKRELLSEITATYKSHAWQLKKLLLTPETFHEIGGDFTNSVTTEISDIDAAWFARPSHEGREAWELRRIAGERFALFELFEPDEAEEDREDVRREMQARLRDEG